MDGVERLLVAVMVVGGKETLMLVVGVASCIGSTVVMLDDDEEEDGSPDVGCVDGLVETSLISSGGSGGGADAATVVATVVKVDVVVVVVMEVVDGVLLTVVVVVAVVAVAVVAEGSDVLEGDSDVDCNFGFLVCGLPGGFLGEFLILSAILTFGNRRLGGLPLYMFVSSSQMSSSSCSFASA